MVQTKASIRLGLVVPALEGGGGVPAVASFILGVALRSGLQVKLISLATSASDLSSTRLVAPQTWSRGVTVTQSEWSGQPVAHVGAVLADFEFQRYKPRSPLKALVGDCDVLQVVCGSPAWANAVIGCGKPVSMHVATRARIERRRREAECNNLTEWWRKAMTVVTDRFDDAGLRGADAVQLMNPWMLEYCRLINKSRTNVDIRYAPPGVDATLYAPQADRLMIDPPYVLCVGRFDDPRKNIGLLLKAFSCLPLSLSHVQLVTAGSGQPPQAYWEQVNALGLRSRVHHVHRPSTSALVKLYQEAKVFALSSDEEGFGMVVVEAMACAVPVVATRCGGPEGIIIDGKNGFLVPLDDAATMANRLGLLCTDMSQNQAMGIAARETVDAQYTDAVTGKAFIDVWRKLSGK